MSEIKMTAVQVGGKIYVEEPEVRKAINAALATNEARNARIAELERRLGLAAEALMHFESYPAASDQQGLFLLRRAVHSAGNSEG